MDYVNVKIKGVISLQKHSMHIYKYVFLLIPYQDVPYKSTIHGGLKHGKTIIIQGFIKKCPTRFDITWDNTSFII